MKCNKRNRKIRYAIFRDSNLNQISNVLLIRTRLFLWLVIDLAKGFPFLDPLFFYIFGRFVKTMSHFLGMAQLLRTNSVSTPV